MDLSKQLNTGVPFLKECLVLVVLETIAINFQDNSKAQEIMLVADVVKNQNQIINVVFINLEKIKENAYHNKKKIILFKY